MSVQCPITWNCANSVQRKMLGDSIKKTKSKMKQEKLITKKTLKQAANTLQCVRLPAL